MTQAQIKLAYNLVKKEVIKLEDIKNETLQAKVAEMIAEENSNE